MLSRRTLYAFAATLAMVGPASVLASPSSSACVLQCQDAVQPGACESEDDPEWKALCQEKVLAVYQECLGECEQNSNNNNNNNINNEEEEEEATPPADADEAGFWPAEPAEPAMPGNTDDAVPEPVDPLCVRNCSVNLGTCYQACDREVHCMNLCSKTYEKCTSVCFHERGDLAGDVDAAYPVDENPVDSDADGAAYPAYPVEDADTDAAWDTPEGPEEEQQERLMEEEAEVMDDIYAGASSCLNGCESALGACLEALPEGAAVAACEDPMRQCLAECLAAPPAEFPADEGDADAVEYYDDNQDGDAVPVEYYDESDGDAVEYYDDNQDSDAVPVEYYDDEDASYGSLESNSLP